MMIFAIIIIVKVTSGFAIAILCMGGYMVLLAAFGAWSSRTKAQRRIYVYNVALIVALLAQMVLAIWYLVNPDIITDAANNGCDQKDMSLTPATCSTSATIWCTGTICAADTTSCCCACDTSCQDCHASVQNVKDYVSDHSSAVAVMLWIILGVEVLALFSACCKQSNAHSRELNVPLLDDGPPTEEAMLDKYGAGATVFTGKKQTYKLGGSGGDMEQQR